MDINSLIANYLKNTNNTEVSASQIKDTFFNLASQDLQNCNSIFVYGEDATKDELIEYMSKACGKDDEQFKEDVGLLFDVLNSNSDDDVLTSDELEFFVRERGDSKGKIDGFGIWNELLNTDVSQIEFQMSEIDSEKAAEKILNSGDIEGGLATYAAIYGEDSDEYKAIEEKVKGYEEVSDTSDLEKISSDDISKIAQRIINGETTLDGVRATGLLSDDEYKELEAQVVALEEEASGSDSTIDINSVAQKIVSGETTLEGVRATGLLSDDELVLLENTVNNLKAVTSEYDSTTDETTTATSESKDVSIQANIPDDVTEIYVQRLLNGMSTSSMDILRNYLDLDSADLVKVLNVYKEEYGSLTKDLEGGLASGLSQDERKELINTVIAACIEQAENGNEDAIKILCNEIYAATAQNWGYTGYTVLNSFFENADNNIITQIKDNYSKYIEGHELRADIDGESMLIHQSEKNTYLARIDKSWQEEV